ncbi:MAG: hypothetical protein LM580_10130 [Thermofilum sp.]|nr:hypothetical protein [Thermofilum sp.]
MSELRSLAVFSALILLVWLSAIALLYTIDVAMMAAVRESWTRTVLGLTAFACWALAWYYALSTLSRELIERARRAGGELRRSDAR